jgi:hypothetical protein
MCSFCCDPFQMKCLCAADVRECTYDVINLRIVADRQKE